MAKLGNAYATYLDNTYNLFPQLIVQVSTCKYPVMRQLLHVLMSVATRFHLQSQIKSITRHLIEFLNFKRFY
jgi:hypothetical protein